jgi:ParB family transcriptional regulator, chromosome partitioning protein
MATFKKKPISLQAVAAAEANAAVAPIVDAPAPKTLGSSQDLLTPMPESQIIHAPLSRVKSNPLNPRAIYTTNAIDEMAVSLGTNGQRVAALGYLDDDGHVVLIEGETRLRGARAAGLDTLRVEIRPKPQSDRELYEMARAANVERRDQTPLDDALRWKELISRKVYPNQAALAKALEVGEDLVSRTMSLAALPPKVIIAAAEYPNLLNLKMLNAIREFFGQQGEESTIDLIHDAAKSGMGYRDVVTRRKAAEKGPVRRPRSVREPLAYFAATGEIKTFEADGRLELVLKGLAASEAAKLVERFKKVLAEPA